MPKVFSLKSVQKMPVSIETAWNFFSDAGNLEKITPRELDFRIISDHRPEKMYAGQLIEYKVRPLFGISVYWMTEITQVEEGKFFVDEQRYGPYALWHHEHHFREIAGGVEMTDIVHYKMPLGFIGRWSNGILVKRELSKIFTYRFKVVEEMFGEWPGGQAREILFY